MGDGERLYVPKLSTRVTAYICGCTKSADFTATKLHWKAMLSKLWHKKQQHLFLMAKCLVWAMAFPTSQKHTIWGSLSSKASKTSLCYNPQFTTGTNNFCSAEACLKIVAILWQILPNETCLRWVSDQRKPTNYTNWWKTVCLSLWCLDPIVCHHLGVRKHFTSWVPHQLTKEQSRGWVEWCLHMLQKIDDTRSDQVWDIIMGGKTFEHQYDQETKQKSSDCLFPEWDTSKQMSSSLNSDLCRGGFVFVLQIIFYINCITMSVPLMWMQYNIVFRLTCIRWVLRALMSTL